MTALNNVDTVVTLVLPSFIIIISNVRISYALSLFYRSIELHDRIQHSHRDNDLLRQQQQQQQQQLLAQQHHAQHHLAQVGLLVTHTAASDVNFRLDAIHERFVKLN